jgi:hypothetical protein
MNNEMMALIDFVLKPRNRCLELFELSFVSFFEDVIEGDFSINDMQAKLGDFVFHYMYPCLMEFFASNEYVFHSISGTDPNWNAIDYFLKNNASKGLRKLEQQFLEGIRKSYMSVYEVLEVKINESILVRDLIQGGEPILVKEKSGTKYIVKWDKLGARLVDCGENVRFAGGLVILPPEVADEAMHVIMTIQSTIDRIMPVALAKKELQRKLWAKEITSAWMKYHLNSDNEKQNLINIDGDKLQFCRVEFPIAGSIDEIVDTVDALPETVTEEPPETAEFFGFGLSLIAKL